MRRRRRRHDDEEAEINITPMLDIVFIMLIFFIVTTSFVREFGLDVTPPDSAAAAVDTGDIIAVRIDAQGAVSVDGRAVDLARVRALIESGVAVKPDASVVIVASRSAAAGVLVTVIDEARSAGVGEISLAEDAS